MVFKESTAFENNGGRQSVPAQMLRVLHIDPRTFPKFDSKSVLVNDGRSGHFTLNCPYLCSFCFTFSNG